MKNICNRCKKEKNETSFDKLKCRNGGRSDVCSKCYDTNQLKIIKRTPEQIESQKEKIKGRKYTLGHRLSISRGLLKNDNKTLNDPDFYRERLEYKIWKEKVKEKDGYKCVICGSEKRLQVHHIKCFYDFPELRFDVNNGEVLCISCHMKHHNPIKEIPARKVCKDCKVEKSIHDFTRCKQRFLNRCKSCRSKLRTDNKR